VNYLKTSPSSEREAFNLQTCIYAVFILLEALATGEAEFRDGTLTVDTVSYNCADHLPTTAIQTYGFAPEGVVVEPVEELSRGVRGLLEGVYLLRASETVSMLEDVFSDACEAKPEWNYYGAFMDNDSALPAEWEERARALFAPKAGSGSGSGVGTEPEPVSTPRFFGKGRTRRMHGRRAFSPIRRNRGTATTRRNKSSKQLLVDVAEEQ
jgi:hypothetical protein